MIRFIIRFETRAIRFLGLFERINRVYPIDMFLFMEIYAIFYKR